MAEVILHYANFSIPPLEPRTALPAEPEPVGLSVQASGEGRARLALDDGSAPRPWRLTEQQKAIALETFRSGASMSEAARVAKMSWGAVHKLLSPEVGDRVLTTGRCTNPVDIAEAAQLRADGWTYQRLADRYGVSRRSVTRRLGGPGTVGS